MKKLLTMLQGRLEAINARLAVTPDNGESVVRVGRGMYFVAPPSGSDPRPSSGVIEAASVFEIEAAGALVFALRKFERIDPSAQFPEMVLLRDALAGDRAQIQILLGTAQENDHG